jgi:dihydropteroate synthase
MLFRARQFEYIFPRPSLVMGIVNVTPDSFSDGGQFLSTPVAVAHALKLVDEGADILDIGGESSRPGAQPVEEAEELRRVIPVIEQLVSQVKVPLSVDTMKPAVARAAVAAGASIINDVAAAENRREMGRIVAESQAGYVAMHGRGFPAGGQCRTSISDIVAEVNEFFAAELEALRRAGVSLEQIILDPGIGFGKGLDHNLQLIAGLRTFRNWQRPVLLGVSRKSFIGKLLGTDVADRLSASVACAVLAVDAGAQMIRTHDVLDTVQALRMTEAVLSHNRYVD